MERNKQSMTPRRWATFALVLALGLPTIFSLLPGCDSTPTEPVYENPFDPDGPDAGDPLQVLAEADNTANSIKLSWIQPQGMGLTHYVISKSPDGVSGWEELDGIDHTTAEFGRYPFTSPEPTSTTWFRVQAFANDNFTITSYANPDSATTGPRVIVGDGGGSSASRFTNLEITVSRGDSLRIALDPTFTDSLKTVLAGV